MPNWCENKLTIYGTKEERAAIREAVKGCVVSETANGHFNLLPQVFALDAIVPMPDHMRSKEDPRWKPAPPMTSDELLDSIAQDGKEVFPDWYMWRTNNWGTKWEVTNPIVVEEKSRLVIDFETAWCYPLPCITALSRRFPTVKMKIAFYEPGCIGRGSATLLNGFVIRETGVGI